jgi:hypothetical protein
MQHSRPHMTKSVREFHKVIYRADEGYGKEMMRLVNYMSLIRNIQLCV